MGKDRGFILPIITVNDLSSEGRDTWGAVGSQSGGEILRGAPGEPTHERILALASQLGSVRESLVGVESRHRSLVHDVKPSTQPTRDSRGVLVLSTTFGDIDLHTDGYNSATDSPRIMLLQAVNPGIGGLTTVARIADVVSALRPNTVERLSDNVFPTTSGTTAVLENGNDGWSVRFNRHEIQSHLRGGNRSDGFDLVHVEALNELVEVLDYESELSRHRIQLQRGDILILDNHKTLHGRLELTAADTNRLLHRAWCN